MLRRFYRFNRTQRYRFDAAPTSLPNLQPSNLLTCKLIYAILKS
jgi:hypothetical protein